MSTSDRRECPDLRTCSEGALLRVRVAAGAREDRIVGVHAGCLKVTLRAAPEKGKANGALLVLLARALGVRGSELSVARGPTSREKWILFAGCSLAHLDAALQALLVTLPPR